MGKRRMGKPVWIKARKLEASERLRQHFHQLFEQQRAAERDGMAPVGSSSIFRLLDVGEGGAIAGAQWPPRLTDPIPSWADMPPENWGVVEWRQYARFLLDGGRELASQLDRTTLQLFETRRKLSRAKSMWPERLFAPEQKAGRRKDEDSWMRAQEAYAIRQEMERDTGASVTNEDALIEWYRRAGLASARALTDRKALSRMRKLHRDRNGREVT